MYKSDKYTPSLGIVYVYCINKVGNYDEKYHMVYDKAFVADNVKYLDYVYMNINIGLIKSIKKSQ